MLTLHGLSRRRSKTMAFVRRKGNAYYLVHNVRRGGKVKQLHLASLGERPRITNDVVKLVEKKHPFVDLDWKELREQVNSSVNLFDPQSPSVQKLVSALRTLNLDLADLFPPVLNVSGSPEVGYEILTQLRLLHSHRQVKLNQFDEAPLTKGILDSGIRWEGL